MEKIENMPGERFKFRGAAFFTAVLVWTLMGKTFAAGMEENPAIRPDAEHFSEASPFNLNEKTAFDPRMIGESDQGAEIPQMPGVSEAPGEQAVSPRPGDQNLKQEIDIQADPSTVWGIVGNFGKFDWCPAFKSAEIIAPGVRRLTTMDGLSIVEKIVSEVPLASGRASYTYVVVSGPLPISNYRSTIRVEPSGQGSKLTWGASYQVLPHGNPDQVRAILTDIFMGGLSRAKEAASAEISRKKAIEGAKAEAEALLENARGAFSQIAGGSADSGDASRSRISVQELTKYYRSPEFHGWVAAEKAAGRQVFDLKDIDKSQSAGDSFTFFFKWLADHGKLGAAQNETMKAFLKTVQVNDPELNGRLARVDANDAQTNADLVIRLWRGKSGGGDGIGLLDFWKEVYWPVQKGLTRQDKLEEVEAFKSDYLPEIYPGIPELNQALADAGVEVVAVSNGDEELAKATAPLLGIKRENVVGSNLLYGADGMSIGSDHSYEIFTAPWATQYPQPGKILAFHYWLNENKERWGWPRIDSDKIVFVGAYGDSASADGGMMIFNPFRLAIGNFMVDTPHEPDRIQKFHEMAQRYGWDLGRFVTLTHDPHSPYDWDDPVNPIPYPKNQAAQTLEPGVAYSVLKKAADWSKGYTTAFAGSKKTAMPTGAPYSSEAFLKELDEHVKTTLAAFEGQGLLGYIVYATREMEFAVMNWESEDRMKQAFQSQGGQSVAAGASRIFKPRPMVWENLTGFSGVPTKDLIEAYLRRVE